MKVCSKCKLEKDFAEYYKSKASKSGYQTYCKDCTKLKNASYLPDYQLTNRKELYRKNKEWSDKNKQYKIEYSKTYYINNREKLRVNGKRHYEENKHLYLHYSKIRKSHIKIATPSCLSNDDFEKIKEIYKNREIITAETGVLHHVDHIVPLRGKQECYTMLITLFH